MIPLYKPYMPPLPELDEILNSGSLAYGRYGINFENVLKKYFDTKNVITTNSFHMAISVVLSVLDIKNGDEIIASPMACLASTQPLTSSKVKIVWADVDPETGTLYPESVEKKITSCTKAIIHNHFCGYPGYIDEINNIGLKYGIPVIDDCIEAFGSEYKGNKIGSCNTDITIFSFTAVRIPNTIDGGAIIFKDKSLYEKSILVRDCGIDRTTFRDGLGEISDKCDISLIGYSATMSNINSYIGIQQMKFTNELISKQRLIASLWNEYFENNYEIKIMGDENINPNYWVYGILVKDKRKTIVEFREKGFHASGVHINNNIYSVFGDKTILNGVNDFYRSFVALPCGWWMDDQKILI